ncbi:uncharacterized protein LOC132725672 [Ruditapes philippinarum]|uniref:uncharacterized protein LOC132725672 n=1 Tax=Ruditapes philippinarum TaxID=129788 RepID=UPI00295B2F5C|nr:uncharacterized protein LOC132725672 [Ruditapes philippinarum]
MAIRDISSSSSSLKSATIILLVVLVIHIVGLSLPRWISVELTVTEHVEGQTTETGYHAGLWQHCGCAKSKFLKTGACLCFSRTNDPIWFNMVQAVETLGLIGLIASMLLSLATLFYQHNKKYKIANVLILLVSGTLMVIGLVVFKVKADTFELFKDLGKIETSEMEIDQVDAKLNYAYFLCGAAGCLSMLVCAPLYVKDLCSYTPDTLNESAVHYTAQAQCLVQGNMDSGYMRTADEQYGFPPAYEQRYVPNNAELPYKS